MELFTLLILMLPEAVSGSRSLPKPEVEYSPSHLNDLT